MAALAAVCAAMPIATAQAAPKSYGSRTLAKPMRGPDVRELQRLLTAWGLPTEIDGQFGRHTKLRVRSWERNSQRRINGRMSRSEAVALRDSVARGETLPGYAPETETAPHRGATEKATIGAGRPGDRAGRPRRGGQGDHRGRQRDRDKPYKYGGGHGKRNDSGYDCSGSMSYALHGAGLLDAGARLPGFMSWGEAGKGQWVTTYANGGHSYMVVAGLRFDTSGLDQDGSRWHTSKRSAAGYTVRHPGRAALRRGRPGHPRDGPRGASLVGLAVAHDRPFGRRAPRRAMRNSEITRPSAPQIIRIRPTVEISSPRRPR